MIPTIVRGPFVLILAVALWSQLAASARAEPSESEIARCERAIAGAGSRSVPQSVLHAISLTETGRMLNGRLRPWPWAINREGQGHWFSSREEALDFARRSVAEGRRSFDVGCFQINYHWHGENFESLEAMFDPDVGAAYAARFLDELHREKGDWSAAAGAYHSRTPQFANKYRARFDRILANIDGAPILVAAASQPEPLAEPPARERKSRERMKKKPLVISIDPAKFASGRRHVTPGEIGTDRPQLEPSPAEIILTQAEPIVLDW